MYNQATRRFVLDTAITLQKVTAMIGKDAKMRTPEHAHRIVRGNINEAESGRRQIRCPGAGRATIRVYHYRLAFISKE